MRREGESALSARALSKSFGEVRAVRSISLELSRGEIYGFLGRNGAGKTTTIRMALGLVRPDSGELSLLGSSLARDREGVLARVGSLVESAAAYPSLTVRENLEIQRRLTRSPRGATERAMATMGLERYADRRAGRLSLGNKQRLSLARALLHGPELLILDEPVNGLDPAGIVEVRRLLRRLADEEGVAVLMSSHFLAEVEQLADRVGLVREGELVEELSREELERARLKSVEVEVDDASRAELVLRGELGLSRLSRTGSSGLRIEDEGASPASIAAALVGAGLALERLGRVEEGLEERFMRLTGGAA